MTTKVYGVERTVIATFSESMRESQIPGIQRDVERAKKELAKIEDRLKRQRAGDRHKPLSATQARLKALKALDREHLPGLFRVDIKGDDDSPTLEYGFDQAAWDDLYENRLGRTLILTTREKWALERIVETLRKQSHVEDAFRQMKDAEWAATMPLRHYTDQMLRAHAFVCVLSLLLSALLVRRLRRGGLRAATISNALYDLSELRATKLRYAPRAPARLKALAKRFEVAPDPTATQRKILGILRPAKRLLLGTPYLNLKTASGAAFRGT
jgi:transposase